MNLHADETSMLLYRDPVADAARWTGLPDPSATVPRTIGEPAARAFTAHLHAELATIASTWKSLQAEGVCTPYQRFEWIESLIGHLALGKTLLLVEIVEAASGRPVMILPMVRIRRRGHTTTEWLDLGVCDYAAPIMAQGLGLSPAEMRQVWAVARSVLPACDLIRITRIPATIAAEQNPLVGLAAVREIAMRRSGLILEGEPATLLKRVCSASAFKGIVKRRKRMVQHGEVHFVCAATGAEVQTLFDILLQQRRARFHDMGRFDLLDRPDVVAFYREAALRGLEDGLVRVFGISIGGKWIATAYGLVHGNAFHGVLLAMGGEAWKPFGPGIMIVAEIMVWARTQKLNYMDFTVGALPYKKSFQPLDGELFELAEARTRRGYFALEVDRALSKARSALESYPAAFERLREGRQFVRRLCHVMRARPRSI